MARVFLSYGRGDASGLAERLDADLIAAGHDVFRDTEQLRAGRAWDTDLGAAIADADALVAVLSPHAVRTADDPLNPDGRDSVCLDEIAHAESLRKPIVPVMAVPCRVPIRLARLHYVDLVGWAALPGVYEKGLTALRTALAAPREVVAIAPNQPRTDPSPLIQRLAENFVGRAWLFDLVGEWADAPRAPPLLLLGEPGIGKSAFLAELIRREGGRRVAAWSFFRAGVPATRQTWRFVHELADQLARHVPLLAQALAAPAAARELTEAACRLDPASAFELGLVTPLASLPAPDRPLIVALDALDEAAPPASAFSESGPTIPELLAGWSARLPTWLRLLATSRPDPVALRGLADARTLRLDAHDPRNLADIAAFAASGFGAARPDDGGDAGIVRLVAARSEGNFLYAREAIAAVAAGTAAGSLPRGLGGLYSGFLERAFPTAQDYAPAARLLEVMLAAHERLPETALPQAAGLSPATARGALDQLAQFLEDDGTGPVPHHWSFAEFLTDPTRGDARFLIDPDAGRSRLIAWCEGVAAGSSYAFAHLPAHLAEVGRIEALATLLAGPFPAAKATALDRTAAAADWGELCRALLAAGRDGEAARLVMRSDRDAAAAVVAAIGAARLPPTRLAGLIGHMRGTGADWVRARAAALGLAAGAGLAAPLVTAAQDRDAALRAAAIPALYRLRNAYPAAGWEALETLGRRLVSPLGVPRGRVLETLGGASLAVISRDAGDAEALRRLAALWQAAVMRLSRAPLARVAGRAWLLGLMRPRLRAVLDAQPDYQPFNFAEMQACYARPPSFRQQAEPIIAALENPDAGPEPLLREMLRPVPFDVHRMLAAERALVVLGARHPGPTLDALERLHRDGPEWFHQSLLYAGLHLLGGTDAPPEGAIDRYLGLAEAIIGRTRGIFATETRRYRLIPHMAWPEVVLARQRPAETGRFLRRWLMDARAGEDGLAERAIAAAALLSFAYGLHRVALACLEPAIGLPRTMPMLAQALADIRFAAPDAVDAFLDDGHPGPERRALAARVRALLPKVGAADFPTWVDAFFNYLLVSNPAFRAEFVGAFRRAAVARTADTVLRDLVVLMARLIGEWRN